MTWYSIVVVAPILGVAAYLITHIAFNVLTAGRNLLIGFLLGFLVGGATEVFVTVWTLRDAPVDFFDAASLVAVNQFTFLALAYGYINSVNLLISSLRVRILHEFFTSKTGLTERQVLDRYGARRLVETRLARLTSSNQLRMENGRFFTKPSLLLTLARFCRKLKTLLLKAKN